MQKSTIGLKYTFKYDERGVSTSYFHELGHQIDEKLDWKFKNDVLIKKKL